MTCSPFLLGRVINEHLKLWETRHPELVKEIRDGLYVDDLMTGGETVNTVATSASERSGKDGLESMFEVYANDTRTPGVSKHRVQERDLRSS